MEVLEDNAMKQEMWRFGDKMFYPQGVTDPDYCVLKFTATQGRYYCDLRTENLDIPE
jgi:general stress protein 26